MRDLVNMVRAAAQMEGQTRAVTRHGIITSYDADTHAVKVTLQPDGTTTGWLPLKALAVGAGWGIVIAPKLGESIEVQFQEDDPSVAGAGWRFFNDTDRPPACPVGEWWFVHDAGASVKWTEDGKLTLRDAGGAVLQLSNDGKIRITGDLIVTGKVTASDDISSTGGDVKAGSISLKTHKTTGITPGSGLSGVPQ
jgi:phage baseplate assembly protein gpV